MHTSCREKPSHYRTLRRARGCGFRILAGLAISLALTGCDGGSEAPYPSRPMFIICPWAQGGGTDTGSRIMAHLLNQETGQPVSVVNRTGGGGVTGHTAGALAEPDGYWLLMVTVEIGMMRWRGLTDLSYKDLKPVMLTNRDPAAVFVHKDAPWKSLRDLREEIAREPGKLRASGTAVGGIWHIALAGALMEMGFEPDAIVWKPSKGAAPGLQDLLSGGIDAAVCSLPEAKSLLVGGEIRCLGVMSASRLETFPDVPTFLEQGVDWKMSGWRGLAVPLGTPDERVAELEKILERIVHGEDFRREMAKLGYGVDIEGSAEFGKTMEETDTLMGELIPRAVVPGSIPGPWFFPALLLGSLLVLGVAVSGLLTRIQVEIVLGVIFYVALVQLLGFIVTAVVLLIYFFKRLGGGWAGSVVVALLLAPAIFFFFARVLPVPLPEGVLKGLLP